MYIPPNQLSTSATEVVMKNRREPRHLRGSLAHALPADKARDQCVYLPMIGSTSPWEVQMIYTYVYRIYFKRDQCVHLPMTGSTSPWEVRMIYKIYITTSANGLIFTLSVAVCVPVPILVAQCAMHILIYPFPLSQLCPSDTPLPSPAYARSS